LRYLLKDVAGLVGQTPARVKRLATEAGLGDGDGQFSFQDLVVLRSLSGVAREVPGHRLRHALRRLRDSDLPSLRITAAGKRVVVRDDGGLYDPLSGQRLLDFAAPAAGESVADLCPIPLRPVSPEPGEELTSSADDALVSADPERLFDIALALEDQDLAAATQVYERLLELAPEHVEAHINLGRLLHEAGALERAEHHYRRGLDVAPADAIAWFNLGVLLDDRELPAAAIEAYRAALGADPQNADAHFNLARLLERSGDELSALRHLTQYRQLRQ
jgi:hypothetical protein